MFMIYDLIEGKWVARFEDLCKGPRKQIMRELKTGKGYIDGTVKVRKVADA